MQNYEQGEPWQGKSEIISGVIGGIIETGNSGANAQTLFQVARLGRASHLL